MAEGGKNLDDVDFPTENAKELVKNMIRGWRSTPNKVGEQQIELDTLTPIRAEMTNMSDTQWLNNMSTPDLYRHETTDWSSGSSRAEPDSTYSPGSQLETTGDSLTYLVPPKRRSVRTKASNSLRKYDKRGVNQRSTDALLNVSNRSLSGSRSNATQTVSPMDKQSEVRTSTSGSQHLTIPGSEYLPPAIYDFGGAGGQTGIEYIDLARRTPSASPSPVQTMRSVVRNAGARTVSPSENGSQRTQMTSLSENEGVDSLLLTIGNDELVNGEASSSSRRSEGLFDPVPFHPDLGSGVSSSRGGRRSRPYSVSSSNSAVRISGSGRVHFTRRAPAVSMTSASPHSSVTSPSPGSSARLGGYSSVTSPSPESSARLGGSGVYAATGSPYRSNVSPHRSTGHVYDHLYDKVGKGSGSRVGTGSGSRGGIYREPTIDTAKQTSGVTTATTSNNRGPPTKKSRSYNSNLRAHHDYSGVGGASGDLNFSGIGSTLSGVNFVGSVPTVNPSASVQSNYSNLLGNQAIKNLFTNGKGVGGGGNEIFGSAALGSFGPR